MSATSLRAQKLISGKFGVSSGLETLVFTKSDTMNPIRYVDILGVTAKSSRM